MKNPPRSSGQVPDAGESAQPSLGHVLAAARALQPRLVDLRRGIHQYPELGNEEHRTAEVLKEQLAALGLTVKTGLGSGGTGLAAEIPGQVEGPAVALRADMDGLPISEASGVSYASRIPGVMHACGHDAHCAMLVGAAHILRKGPQPPRRKIILIFQPSEEREPLGARSLVQEGILDDPPVSSIFALHVTNDLQAGEIGLRYGPRNASADTLRLAVTGRSAHAARPHLGVDAIVAAASVVQAIQDVIARRVNVLNPAVVTFGRIEGGTAPNVVADRVVLTGTLRCLSAETRSELPGLLAGAAAHAAATLGAECELVVEPGEPVLFNDESLTRTVELVATELIGVGCVHHLPQPSMGAEDFAFYLDRVPGAQVSLGTGNSTRGITAGLHTPTFDIDEDALAVGAAVLAGTALRAAEVA
jgi:amidohydrolase